MALLQNRRSFAFYTSAFLSAVTLFGAINAAIGRFHPYTRDPDRYAHKTWTWWTMKDLSACRKSPNVALLGSSLMVTAISLCDAAQAHRDLDLASYRSATYLDDRVKDKIGCDLKTFNFSSPGQMPSDAYLTLKAALANGAKPDMVIYGVAPRDFFDGTLCSPSETEAYKLLANSVDLEGSDLDFFVSPETKVESVIQRCLAISQFGNAARCLLGDALTTVKDVHPIPPTETSTWLEDDMRASSQPLFLDKGRMMATSNPIFQKPEQLAFDIENYRARYKNPKPVAYRIQFRFLNRIARLCKSNQISLTLINMPLTQTNKNLLRKDLHQKYLADMQDFSRKTGATYLDLDDNQVFTASDFRDIVHLNGGGGKKLIDVLLARASKQDSLKETFLAAARAAEFRQLAASPGRQL